LITYGDRFYTKTEDDKSPARPDNSCTNGIRSKTFIISIKKGVSRKYIFLIYELDKIKLDLRTNPREIKIEILEMQNIFPYWTGKETQARRLAQKL
jgi:hypothetical protein